MISRLRTGDMHNATVFEHIEFIQALISICTGFLGIGIGIGIFKGTIRQVKKDIERLDLRQKRLRGEDDGGKPIFMTAASCLDFRDHCEVIKHGYSIKALENYARWEMQNKGLKIEEINRILNN